MTRPRVIDADGHIFEKQEDIRKYLEPPWDRRPSALFPSGPPWDTDLFDTLGWIEMRRGTAAQQVDIWLQVMDRESFETVVIFPSGAGSVASIPEPAFAAAVARAANTHFARDYGARSKRLRPVGVLPLRDPQVAASELRRAVTELGLVSFELLSTGVYQLLGDRAYDPLYAEARRLNVPLCIHGTRGNTQDVGAHRFQSFLEAHCFTFPASVIMHFTNIMFNAVPLRFPGLKLAFLEIGASWLPYYLPRMDEHWELRGRFETPLLTKKPTDLIRESPIYVSVEAKEPLLPQTIAFLGEDHFLYASDFPHWDAGFPKNVEELESRPDLSQQAKRKLLYHNAKAFFDL